ncbi:MAG: helix-turn-helix transcriptional regulator [Ardenticatenia bacterium]|nr:helix-turn-helix transcriptional regulator [Ardenticatenia bacterium]
MGARLKRLREAAGLSPEALAAEAGLTPDVLLSAEEGEIELDMATLVTLAKRLHASLEEIIPVATSGGAENGVDLPPELVEWLTDEEHRALISLLQTVLAQPVEAITAVGRLLLEVALIRVDQEEKGA